MIIIYVDLEAGQEIVSAAYVAEKLWEGGDLNRFARFRFIGEPKFTLGETLREFFAENPKATTYEEWAAEAEKEVD